MLSGEDGGMVVLHQGALLAGMVLADILGILAEIQVLAGI